MFNLKKTLQESLLDEYFVEAKCCCVESLWSYTSTEYEEHLCYVPSQFVWQKPSADEREFNGNVNENSEMKSHPCLTQSEFQFIKNEFRSLGAAKK